MDLGGTACTFPTVLAGAVPPRCRLRSGGRAAAAVPPRCRRDCRRAGGYEAAGEGAGVAGPGVGGGVGNWIGGCGGMVAEGAG